MIAEYDIYCTVRESERYITVTPTKVGKDNEPAVTVDWNDYYSYDLTPEDASKLAEVLQEAVSVLEGM